MLQRTRAKSVVPVYERLVREYPDPQDLAGAALSEVEGLIFSLGLRWRAPLIRDLARELYSLRELPVEYDELRALPGVGDYVASAWQSLHSKRRAILIDANVVRWLCRMRGVAGDGETRRQPWVRELADQLTPQRSFHVYNYAVLDFTMTVCGVSPRCSTCPLRHHGCAYAGSSNSRTNWSRERSPMAKSLKEVL
jgi:A/G-specific adenine glycosylase